MDCAPAIFGSREVTNIGNLRSICCPPTTGRNSARPAHHRSRCPLDAATYLAERKVLLHEQLTRVGQLLKDNALPDVRIDKNKVRITPLDAEIPEGVEELARKAYAKVRRIKITQLLIEDRPTDPLQSAFHASAQWRSRQRSRGSLGLTPRRSHQPRPDQDGGCHSWHDAHTALLGE